MYHTRVKVDSQQDGEFDLDDDDNQKT